MNPSITWMWQATSAADKHGTATYMLEASGSISVPLPNFKTAFDLAKFIEQAQNISYDGGVRATTRSVMGAVTNGGGSTS